jgi:hypothetical protein
MNIITKKSALNLAIFSVLTLNRVISALAGTVSGQIDNKSQSGWKLTVASSNIGKLVRGYRGHYWNHLFRYPIVVRRVSSGISYYCIGGLWLYT